MAVVSLLPPFPFLIHTITVTLPLFGEKKKRGGEGIGRGGRRKKGEVKKVGKSSRSEERVAEKRNGRWITGEKRREGENFQAVSRRWFLLKMWVAY